MANLDDYISDLIKNSKSMDIIRLTALNLIVH